MIMDIAICKVTQADDDTISVTCSFIGSGTFFAASNLQPRDAADEIAQATQARLDRLGLLWSGMKVEWHMVKVKCITEFNQRLEEINSMFSLTEHLN
jgi:hypothetical protein